MDYFSKKKRGGVTASKIDNQDSVAVITALELISDQNPQRFWNFDNEWTMSFEGNDDIEICDGNKREYIQVKTPKLDKTVLIEILENFLENMNLYKDTYDSQYFSIYVLEGLSDSLQSLPQKIMEYNNSKRLIHVDISEKILTELMKEYSLESKFRPVLENIYIDTRYLLRDSIDTIGVFSYYLRKSVVFRDIGENLSKRVYTILLDEIGKLRRSRNGISKKNVISIISNELKNNDLTPNYEIFSGYKRVEHGYVRERNDNNEKLINAIKKLKKNVNSEWRKAYFKEFLLSLILGASKCPECRHPMMANMNGLYGIACPDCGFQPYLTMFLGCYCGNFVAIKEQPELSSELLYEYIFEYFDSNDTKCDKCGISHIDDYILERVMIAPYPYPFDSFDLKELYDKYSRKNKDKTFV